MFSKLVPIAEKFLFPPNNALIRILTLSKNIALFTLRLGDLF